MEEQRASWSKVTVMRRSSGLGQDADSEGEEGKFYVWSEDEIRDILEPEELQALNLVYNVSNEGNYRDEATRKKTGKNILHMKKTLVEYASQLNVAARRRSRSSEAAFSFVYPSTKVR